MASGSELTEREVNMVANNKVITSTNTEDCAVKMKKVVTIIAVKLHQNDFCKPSLFTQLLMGNERKAEITNKSTSMILPSSPLSNVFSLSPSNAGNILKRIAVGIPKARPRKKM